MSSEDATAGQGSSGSSRNSWRRLLRRGWDFLKRFRFSGGMLAGAAVGVSTTLLVTTHLLPALRSDGLEPGTLVILSGSDDGIGGQRQALIDQWNALPDRPKARIIPIEGGADAQHAEMVSRAQSPSGSGEDNIDIFNLDVTWVAEFADAGYIRPLDTEGLDTSGFLDKPLETCWYSDELWGLPFNTDAGLLFYRSDLVGDDPPGSWDAMLNKIDEVFSGDLTGQPELEAGFATQLDDYEGLTVNAFELIWGAGGEVVDDDGDVVIDSEAAREGLSRLATGLTHPRYILRDSRTFKEEATWQVFRNRQVLFMRNWPVAYRQIAGETGGEEATGDPLVFRTAVLPRGSVLGGQNLAVAEQSDQPRAAQELIEFLTSERSQQILFERGGFAATRELVYQDPAVREERPYAETLLRAVRSARLRPVTPYYYLFSAQLREEVNHALDNGGALRPGAAERLADTLDGQLG